MLESDVALRELILKTVTERAAEHGGALTRADLSHLMLPNGLEVRVIDQSRGIWNPRSMDATLSVVSNPDGPYSDRHVAGGLFHYSYRAGSDEGDNRKLRRAFELELPIILLQRLEPGVFVTHAPVYVVDDLRDQREFLLALDESVRFLPKDLPADAPLSIRSSERHRYCA
jgi:putative restriction endonuclease